MEIFTQTSAKILLTQVFRISLALKHAAQYVEEADRKASLSLWFRAVTSLVGGIDIKTLWHLVLMFMT